MKKIVVSSIKMAFGPGAVIGLSDEQYTTRKHALLPVKGRKGLYLVEQRVEFKRGESINIDTLDQTPDLIEIESGNMVAMSEEQYAARQHLLEPVKGKKGLFKTIGSIMLKKDEFIGVEKQPVEPSGLYPDVSDNDLIEYAAVLGIADADKIKREVLEKLIADALAAEAK